jgi:hypothetical protein
VVLVGGIQLIGKLVTPAMGTIAHVTQCVSAGQMTNPAIDNCPLYAAITKNAEMTEFYIAIIDAPTQI